MYFHSDTVDPRWSRTHYQTDPAPAIKIATEASRFEFGTRSWHLFGALANAIDYLTALTLDGIEAHMAAMSSTAKAALAEIPGVTMLTPRSWDDSSALVTFTVQGMSGEDASKRLWEDFRIAQRRVEVPSAVRVSTAYFTSIDDIQTLAAAVDSLARNR